jgi:pyruvate dehydrogenase E1 component beta subunit
MSTYSEAIYEATKLALAADSSVRVFGEGVADPLGSYGTTRGLHHEFGAEVSFDVPIAEGIITGMGVGMAMVGLRPIMIHPRNDFLLLALDQICNHAAKWDYMYAGKSPLPLVVRSVSCRGWGSAAQHSQSIHATLAHFPGLTVLVPFTPGDAKGFLLWAALKSQGPVVIMENKGLWKLMGEVPEGEYFCEPGQPQVLREGSDVTMVGVSQGSLDAMVAAEKLADDGVSVEVIDVRSLKPLDVTMICDSVKKTGRLMVVDPAPRLYGSAAEIISRVMELVPVSALKASPVRVALPDTPVPASSEATYFFTHEQVVKLAKKLVAK